MSSFPARVRNITVIAAILGLPSCETADRLRDSLRDATPRERYVGALEVAGLDDAALARDWIAAGAGALDEPLEVTLPFSEATYITPAQPRASAYKVTLERGRKLTVAVNVAEHGSGEVALVFTDLFRVPDDPANPLRPVASADSVPWRFEYEPWRGGDFVVRVQPELLRGGNFTVELGHEAQLAFPVEGRDIGAILSFFGDERDGGRRRHHGVDIFARRGTPVLAASAGEVYGVRDTEVGGKVVWVRDSVRDARVYYAHLESQAVRNGERVLPGDTLGFVGNSGNARTTPPHLHFGLYRRGRGPDRGPTDPMPFLKPPPGRLAQSRVDGELLGGWVRISGNDVRLRQTPSGMVLGSLGLNTVGRALTGAADSGTSAYWVEFAGGRTGYVAAEFVERASEVTADGPDPAG